MKRKGEQREADWAVWNLWSNVERSGQAGPVRTGRAFPEKMEVNRGAGEQRSTEMMKRSFLEGRGECQCLELNL